MDNLTRDPRDEAMPFGVDTIRLHVTWPAAPVSQGYNGRMWRMRPLRGWTGEQARDGEPSAGAEQGGDVAIPIADRLPAVSNGNGGTQPALNAGADSGTVPNAAPPSLDPNRPFVVDRRYDDALRRVRATPPHFGAADAPVPAMPDGGYQPGLAFLMQRIASARPEDLPQLYADIRALYMQPGANRTGEALIRAAGDAAEAGSDLRARRELLSGIAPIAKSDPLQLAADEFGLAAAVLPGGGASAVVEAVESGESAVASALPKAGESLAPGTTETIWDAIKPTQELWPNTAIPRSFEMSLKNGGRVWVHPNATEHLDEYAKSMLGRGVSSDLINVESQVQLRSLQAAVEAATMTGVPFGQSIQIGGWELRFGVPRSEGQLPVLMHARPLR